MKKIYSFALLCFSILWSSAQITPNQHYCHTDEVWADMVKHDSSLLQNRQQMDKAIAELANKYVQGKDVSRGTGTGATVVIPTVIYVVYDDPSVNISMKQVQSQMDQLNASFAPYGFSFCYAKRNVTDTSYFQPQAGDSAGVFRINSALSNVNEYSTDAQLKALSALPPANYLRIFIVHRIAPSGVLGYALLPGSYSQRDGIIMLSEVFGSKNYCSTCSIYPNYDQGATLVHELGHYLGLYHTFQGGCDTDPGQLEACQLFGDQVCDTPPTEGAFGCPAQAPFSCDGVNRALVENYMDYTNDPCKNSFTAGQKSRMDLSLQAYRSALVSTANLINTGVKCVEVGNKYAGFYTNNFNGCTGRTMTFASLHSAGFKYNWDFGDGTTAKGDTVTHTYATEGRYNVVLNAVNTSQSIDVSTTRPVFITPCTPSKCAMNKWDFEYGYLDFSSGNPIATNHKTAYPNPQLPDFYMLTYRADTFGRPLFHLGWRALSNMNSSKAKPLLDTSFVQVDSINNDPYNESTDRVMIPVPGRTNTYCLVRNSITYNSDKSEIYDTVVYTIIQSPNNVPSIMPGKRDVKLPFPTGLVGSLSYRILAIPNCDGTAFWVIVFSSRDSKILVFRFDSTMEMTYQSSYTLPTSLFVVTMVASPDGRTIAINLSNASHALCMSTVSLNKANGIVSNYLPVCSVQANYPAPMYPYPCFSPNSRFLYFMDACCQARNGGAGQFCQLDMYSANPYTTRKVVFEFPMSSNLKSPAFYPKIGPDKKLYLGAALGAVIVNDPDNFRFRVVNYPDKLEDGLNSTGYNAGGPDVRPVNCPYPGISITGYGMLLPDRVEAFDCGWQPGVPMPFSYVGNGSCLSYKFYSDECWSVQWNFGDTASGASNTSTLAKPVHQFSAPGTYRVTLLVNGYTLVDSVRVTVPQVKISGSPVSPCPAPMASYSVSNVQPFVSYNWSVTNGIPASVLGEKSINVQWNKADTTGRVSVIAMDTVTGCSTTALLNVAYKLTDSVAVNYKRGTICQGNSYVFGARRLTVPGVYSDTAIIAGGCKSITWLTLSYAAEVNWNGGVVSIPSNSGAFALSGGTPTGGIYSGTGVYNNVFYPDSVITGTYTITYTYTDSVGCTGSVTRSFVITATEPVDESERIQLYPNPAASNVIIRSALFANTDVQVSLFDLTGRLINVPQDKYADKAILDVSSLAEGVYCLRLMLSSGQVSKRFVKME